ncbi:MAG: AmmeMemoRadiSam system radical SAM enzyme, partial [Endomicrobiia bacterium]|nr:AmmeMemoRadiSam system radical SAM enzyme [Endomicrobiia bacterium]
RMAAVHLDPIEKKPLYHFYPGSMILSVGTAGCNFRCSHCQNWEISRSSPDEVASSELTPREALDMARRLGSIGVAYTYNEPLINFEWVLETSRVFAEAKMKNVLVTNGFIAETPWREALEYIDAANIDLKAFDDDFYRKICGGRLDPVLRSIEIMIKSGRHVEVTCLIIPGQNDDIEKIEEMAAWLASLDKKTPFHLSRYFPNYRATEPPTPISVLEAARDAAQKHLDRVYLGNV